MTGMTTLTTTMTIMTITVDNDYNNKYYDKDYHDFNDTKTNYFDKIRSPWHVAKVCYRFRKHTTL